MDVVLFACSPSNTPASISCTAPTTKPGVWWLLAALDRPHARVVRLCVSAPHLLVSFVVHILPRLALGGQQVQQPALEGRHVQRPAGVMGHTTQTHTPPHTHTTHTTHTTQHQAPATAAPRHYHQQAARDCQQHLKAGHACVPAAPWHKQLGAGCHGAAAVHN